MASEERLRELEEKYEGYTVYDNQGSKIGKVDDLFVDEKDNEEYIGVKMGFFGRKSTLIPTEVVRVNEGDRTIEVADTKDHVKDAPSFDDDEDVTADYEERIRRHFGLESLQGQSGRGSYSGAAGTAAGAAAGSGTSERDEDRETATSGYAPSDAGGRESSAGTTREETYSGDRGSTGGTFESERGTSSGTDSEYAERHEDTGTAPAAGGTAGASGYTDDQQGQGGASGMSGTSQAGTSGSQPTTSKQTEETETFQEGGRTKIRRRIIREEIVDADEQT